MKATESTVIPSFNSLEYASKTFHILEKLCAERQEWEGQEYLSSTARLYNLLAAVYGVYEKKFVDAKDEDRRTLRQQLVGKLNEAGIGVRKSTDTLGLLIRYVFQADRRRVMSYKYAILAARSHDVSYEELPEWLSNEGGLEEVARKVSFSQETLDRREELLKSINRVQEVISKRSGDPLGVVTLPIKAMGNRVMMLAEPDSEGGFKILYVFDNPTDGVQSNLIRQAATSQASVQMDIQSSRAEAANYINFNRLTKSDERIAA